MDGALCRHFLAQRNRDDRTDSADTGNATPIGWKHRADGDDDDDDARCAVVGISIEIEIEIVVVSQDARECFIVIRRPHAGFRRESRSHRLRRASSGARCGEGETRVGSRQGAWGL